MIIEGRLMMKEGHWPTKLLHALTWDAFDHASHAPQVKECNYYVYMYSYTFVSTVHLTQYI